MIATSQPKAKVVHPLSRYVTKEAIALLLNLQPEEIYKIDCWRYVIHVVGKGVSSFVSYADIPPILGLEPPTPKDLLCWRKRWQKNKYKFPSFWVEFYAQKFQQATSLEDLYAWGELVTVFKFGMSEIGIEWLRSVYSREREFMLANRL